MSPLGVGYERGLSWVWRSCWGWPSRQLLEAPPQALGPYPTPSPFAGSIWQKKASGRCEGPKWGWKEERLCVPHFEVQGQNKAWLKPGVSSPEGQALGLLFRRPSYRVEQGSTLQQHLHLQPILFLERERSGDSWARLGQAWG